MRAAQIEIGLSKVRILGRCSLKMRNRFLKLALMEENHSQIKTGRAFSRNTVYRARSEGKRQKQPHSTDFWQ